MNWKALFLNSQSNPGLVAVSGDFSEDEFRTPSDTSETSETSENCISVASVSTSTLTSINSSETTNSNSISSLKLKVSSQTLSWQRNWLLIPACSLIFLTVLPFLQGCLYTIGYRLGRKTLKLIINKT